MSKLSDARKRAVKKMMEERNKKEGAKPGGPPRELKSGEGPRQEIAPPGQIGPPGRIAAPHEVPPHKYKKGGVVTKKNYTGTRWDQKPVKYSNQ